MREIKLVFILIAWMMVKGSMDAQEQTPEAQYTPLRLSFGKHFPASKRSLLRMRDTPGQYAKLRTHAWDLFEGLTQEPPIWDTWYTKCDLHLKKCAPQPEAKPHLHKQILNLEVPIQSLDQLFESGSLQDRQSTLHPEFLQQTVSAFIASFLAHPQFASVMFNREARDHIVSQCLYSENSGGLPRDKHCPSLPSSGKIKKFPRGAVVLKTAWERVKVNPETGIGKLTTWKPELWNIVQHANDTGIEARLQKPDPLQIDSKLTSPSDCENRDYEDGEVVPLSCFYSIQISQADYDALKTSGSLTDIIPTGWAVGDYLILVAVHVTTKEIPDWVWATFWWDNHGKSDPRASGRPTTLGSKWTHFLMDTTLSGMTPRESDRGPKVCFNPYLETRFTNGAISNCLQCHSTASYGPSQQGGRYDQGILGRDGKTLAIEKAPDPHYFHNRVKTDFMWSVAGGLDSNVQNLLLLFRNQLHLPPEELFKKQPGATAPKPQ